MEISPSQLMNPGMFGYADERRKEIERFKQAVDRAKFLDREQKGRWKSLGYLLSSVQLDEARHLIIAENLNRLKARQKLETLKSKEK